MSEGFKEPRPGMVYEPPMDYSLESNLDAKADDFFWIDLPDKKWSVPKPSFCNK